MRRESDTIEAISILSGLPLEMKAKPSSLEYFLSDVSIHFKWNRYAFKGGSPVRIDYLTLEKGSKGSKFFPLRLDPISEGAWFIRKQTGSY